MARKAAIVLTRLDSARFPGKALVPVRGTPLLQRCVEALLPARDFMVLVATTSRPCDDPIVRLASQLGVECFRGNTEDVALRALQCAQAHGVEIFARVNGDSPFQNIELLRQGFAAVESGRYDFCTNLVPRAFPYGVSVEVVRTAFFAECYSRFSTPYHREHVTAYLYENLDAFRVCRLAYPAGNDHDVRLAIDTPSDLAVVEGVLAQLDDTAAVDIPALVDAYRRLQKATV